MNKGIGQQTKKFFMVYRPEKQEFERIDFAVASKTEQPSMKVDERQIPQQKK